jgi:hypothetical protein
VGELAEEGVDFDFREGLEEAVEVLVGGSRHGRGGDGARGSQAFCGCIWVWAWTGWEAEGGRLLVEIGGSCEGSTAAGFEEDLEELAGGVPVGERAGPGGSGDERESAHPFVSNARHPGARA